MAQPIRINQPTASHPASEETTESALDSQPQGYVTAEAGRCEPLIDAAEAARILGIHVTCLKARAAKQEIPGFKIGARWKFRKSVLDRWIQAQLSSTRCSRP